MTRSSIVYKDINQLRCLAKSVHRLLQTGKMAVFCAEKIGSLFVAILTILLQVNCDDSALLEAYWGQEGTTFNDSKSCFRECDGTPKVCYYKFKAENYNTMGS